MYINGLSRRGLMTTEDLDTMGFGPESAVKMGKHEENPGDKMYAHFYP